MEDLILMLDFNGKQEAVRPKDVGHYKRLGYTLCEITKPEPDAEQPDAEGTNDEAVEAAEVNDVFDISADVVDDSDKVNEKTL